MGAKSAIPAGLLALLLAAGAGRAHTLDAPETIQAGPGGFFSYIWHFTVGPGPAELEGFGWWGSVNVLYGQHVDCFCPGCTFEEGETLDFFVSGNLTDPSQDGVVDNWVAQCSSPDIRVDTIVLRYDAVSAELPVDAGPRLLETAPNPFATALNLTVRLETASHVLLEVLDVRGRRVREVFRGEVPAGATRFEWNGRDTEGVPRPVGVYFVRLRSDAADDVIRKVTRIR